jgi:hypothetical protein
MSRNMKTITHMVLTVLIAVTLLTACGGPEPAPEPGDVPSQDSDGYPPPMERPYWDEAYPEPSEGEVDEQAYP